MAYPSRWLQPCKSTDVILACGINVSEALRELEQKSSELQELRTALGPVEPRAEATPCFLREVEALVERTLALREISVAG